MASPIENLFKVRRKKNYDVRKTAVDNRKYVNNNYRENMLQNSISKYIFRNSVMNDFVVMIQHILADLVDSVTYLKGFKSYTTKKDDTRLK
jgi:hypothetical protein